MSLCDKCIEGSLHEGTPRGKVEKLNGAHVYVTLPSTTYDKKKALLFLPDVFGAYFKNSQLVADAYAEHGYATYVIDYLNGEPITEEQMNSKTFHLPAWLSRHPQSVTRPHVDKLLEELRGQGVTEIAAHGYCFGARAGFDLVQEDILKVLIVSHPSLLKNPEDLHQFGEKGKAALLINSCEFDPQFPADFQQKADEILGDGKYKPGYKRTYFEGASHGFGTRADLENKQAVAAKEGSFHESVKFLREKF